MTLRYTFASLAATLLGCTSFAHAQDASLLDEYFTLFETQSANTLPLAETVTFDGTTLPQPIVGRPAVIGFLNQIVPSLGIEEIEVVQRFETLDGACVELVFQYEARDAVEYAHCLEFENGEITAIRLYFDPRPFLRE